jgi:hypothetical protein
MTTVFNLTGNVRLVPTWEDTIGPVTLSDATTFLQTLNIANGTGTGQANAYWRDVRSVAATTTDEIELDSLPMSVMEGTGTLDLATVRMLYVRNRGNVTLDVLLGGGQISVPANGLLFWNAPSAPASPPLGASNPPVLEIQNAAATAGSYEILLVGVSA